MGVKEIDTPAWIVDDSIRRRRSCESPHMVGEV